MEKYTIGYEVDGIRYMDVADNSADEIKDSMVAIILTEESNGKLYRFYSLTRRLIINGNRIILIMDGMKSRIRKQISMLLMSYRIYDIYTVEGLSIITDEYIESLEEREPSEDEVTTFIGSDITAYSEINEVLLSMIDSINESNVDKLKELVESKRENIEEFVDIIDYMKQVVDKVNSGDADKKINDLKDKVGELEKFIEDRDKEFRSLERAVEIAKEENELNQKEAFKAKQRVNELQEKLNSREPVIRTYTEVQTQMLRCKVKVVVYFKEVSYISYMASMVTKFVESLVRIRRLKVKLMVYDNKTNFLEVYKPLNIVGSSEFINSREFIVRQLDKIIVVEANQALIEEVLVSDWDVVVIYDRLKQANDIVSGNNVYKYWVMNSVKEFNELKRAFRIDTSRIITNPGVIPESLAIQPIKEYKTHSDSAKLADYIGMVNSGINRGKLFDMIVEATHINTLQGRARE